MEPSPTRARAPLPLRRRLLFLVVFLLLAAVASAVTGEAALRVIYRDHGRTTLGAPGNGDFEYRFNPAGGDPESRHPAPFTARQPGVTRLAIQGDSITYGVGVKEWTDLYPSRLLAKLQAAGGQYDFYVEGVPGYNIDRHADHLPRIVQRHAPDVLVYQWYANDLDVGARRAVPPRIWQQWPGHARARRSSFLYFFLDNRLDRLIPQPYQRHLQDDFAPGSYAWTRFHDEFHRWATVAAAYVPRTILLLYPQVPFSGRNPLADLHGRMTTIATGTSRLEFPPTLHEEGGMEVANVDVGEHVLLHAGDTPLLSGHYVVDFEVRLDAAAEHPGHVRVIDRASGTGVADVEIPHDAVGSWVHVAVPFDITRTPLAEHIEFQVTAAPAAKLTVGTIGLDVRYRHIEVLDPTDRLNTFDTHASIFDAHPNARAHGVLADALYERLMMRSDAGGPAH